MKKKKSPEKLITLIYYEKKKFPEKFTIPIYCHKKKSPENLLYQSIIKKIYYTNLLKIFYYVIISISRNGREH
jgi:hypothetical protein